MNIDDLLRQLHQVGVRAIHTTEIALTVEEDAEGGYVAQAAGQAIVTQADDLDALREQVRDAGRCHLPDESERPKLIRLHIVDAVVIAA
ncbi:MAG: 2-oxoisovalerate dehydrogenase [Planctomycetota bacterium]